MSVFVKSENTTPQEALDNYRKQSNAEDRRQISLFRDMSKTDRFELLMYMIFFTNELLGHVHDVVCDDVIDHLPDEPRKH